MTASTILTPDEIMNSFLEAFKDKIKESRIEKYVRGKNNNEFYHLWLKIDKSIYKDVVKHLFTFTEYPHFAVSSGYDLGETVELVHHFSIYHGEKLREININITTSLPKDDLTIDTITDLIPGALIAEQEKQEMLGIKVIDIPKDERVFISKDFPDGIYPWRRDETSADKIARNLHDKIEVEE